VAASLLAVPLVREKRGQAGFVIAKR
jgi:hypothetical protein